MISEDLKVHFTNKLNGDLIIANDINELKDKHNKGIDELVQLEQDVNVLRGDVQGVYGLKSEASSRKGISLGDTFAFEVWFKCSPSKNNIKGYYFNIKAENDSFIIYTGNTDTNNIYSYAYNELGGHIALIDGKVNADKYTHLIMAYDGNIFQVALNGVLKEYAFPNLRKPSDRGLWIEDKSQVSLLRHYNINKSTQQQIDFLYNQGRFDEVVLGDEWRIPSYSYDKSLLFGSGCSLTSIGDEVSITTDDGPIGNGVSAKLGISNIDRKSYKIISFKAKAILPRLIGALSNFSEYSADALKQQIISNPPLSAEYQDYIAICNPDIRPALYFHTREAGDVGKVAYVVRDFKCSSLTLTNEYLPKYLTQTKWIDNGVSKQDIPLTAPTFTYIRPYKQHLFGSGAPSIIPDAAFTEYSDTATGNIWKCGTKPNTRQFAVSDWKQINN